MDLLLRAPAVPYGDEVRPPACGFEVHQGGFSGCEVEGAEKMPSCTPAQFAEALQDGESM